MARLPPQPELDWDAQGIPSARAFGDVYFSRAGGLAESETVFLQGCGLPEAWAQRDRFAICELGFGSGLNVLAAWRAWRTARKPHAVLHMCSIEAFPLDRDSAARALGAFPEAADLSAKLLAHWPVRAYAPQRLWFPEDGFALTVLTGEARALLDGMHGRFDAWFLDGFSPARNPAMWEAALFERIAALSAPGARAATFTVAGDVRRGLEAAGFTVEKKPGFGAKRERLEARLASTPSQPHSLYPYGGAGGSRVAIIGAGIAGAATARALMRRGADVALIDRPEGAAASASANPAGLVMPRLDRGGALSEVFLAAYLEAIAAYAELGDAFTPCGVIQHPGMRDGAALADLLADPPLPADWLSAGNDSAAWHPRAGLVRPQAAIESWTRNARRVNAHVAEIAPAGDGWRVIGAGGAVLLEADAIVLACGPALAHFAQTRFLPLERSRGQIEHGPVPGGPPAHACVSGAYAAPFGEGLLFGATFDPTDSDAPITPNEDARARNLVALERLAPDLAARLDRAKLAARAALRATTPDRAPIAGLVPDAPAWLAQHAGLARGHNPNLNTEAPAHRGVYVIGGLGARGLTLAPLLGERVASEIFQEPQALSRPALDAIHPARFLHRTLRRGG